MKTIIHIILSACSILLAAYYIPSVSVASVWVALLVAIVLGILNASLRPLLLFLTLPVTILTFGFFALIVNTLMILLAAAVVPGFHVASFGAAFLFGIVLFFLNAVAKVLV